MALYCGHCKIFVEFTLSDLWDSVTSMAGLKKGLVVVFTNREVPVSAAGEHKKVMEKMPHVAEQVSSVVLRANGGRPHVLSVEQSFSGSLCADQLTAKRSFVLSI